MEKNEKSPAVAIKYFTAAVLLLQCVDFHKNTRVLLNRHHRYRNNMQRQQVVGPAKNVVLKVRIRVASVVEQSSEDSNSIPDPATR